MWVNIPAGCKTSTSLGRLHLLTDCHTLYIKYSYSLFSQPFHQTIKHGKVWNSHYLRCWHQHLYPTAFSSTLYGHPVMQTSVSSIHPAQRKMVGSHQTLSLTATVQVHVPQIGHTEKLFTLEIIFAMSFSWVRSLAVLPLCIGDILFQC